MKARSTSGGRGKGSRPAEGAGRSGASDASVPPASRKRGRRPARGAAKSTVPAESAVPETNDGEEDAIIAGDPTDAELGEVLIPEIALPLDDALPEADSETDGSDGGGEAAAAGGRAAGRGRRGTRRTDAAGRPGGAVTRYDALGGYIREVRAIPTLSREEELDLARRYRDAKDPEAARRLVVANLSLVVKIALMFRRAIANALDLIQEGNLGLLQAVEKFDPDMGVRFTTYAAWWVKAYILKYLLDNARLVRVGTTNARRKLIYNLQREKARLDALGIETGPKLLAERFGVSEEDVKDVQATLEAGEVALDAPIAEGSEDGKTRAALLADPGESVEEQVARRELQQSLEEKIRAFSSGLNERDRFILENRLLAEDPLTLQAIGEKFSVTREAVRLSEERVVRQLKEYLRTELGEDVLLQVRR